MEPDLIWTRTLVLAISALLFALLTWASVVSPIWSSPALFKTHHNATFIHFLYDAEQHFIYDPSVALPTNLSTDWQSPYPDIQPHTLRVAVLTVFSSGPNRRVCSETSCCVLHTESTHPHTSFVAWLYGTHLVSDTLYLDSITPLCDRILWCEQCKTRTQCFYVP
jgi:hypothetical protein